MPDSPPPPKFRDEPTAAKRPPVPRLTAVVFDFHGTLAQVEPPVEWVTSAARACGVALDRLRATVLADRLVTAGRPGGPPPGRIPPQLAEVWATRDLYPDAHRAAYTGLAATVDHRVEGLPAALYQRLLDPSGWVAYPDAVPVLTSLRAMAVPVAVISNSGFDLRPIAAGLGIAELVDEFVLSCEVGRCKPDPAIFLRACMALRTDPEHVLVVGDGPVDAGAAEVGCTVLVLPAAAAGTPNGLSRILPLLCDPHHE